MIRCMNAAHPGPLGQAIEERLENLGWSRNELARRAGIDSGTVSRLIRGLHEPNPSTLEAIAKALGVETAYLMRLAGFAVGEGEYDPEAAYIARQLTELPPYLREQAIDAVGGVVDSFIKVAGLPPREKPGRKPDPRDDAEVQAIIAELLRLAQEKPEALKQIMEQVQMLQQGKASSEG